MRQVAYEATTEPASFPSYHNSTTCPCYQESRLVLLLYGVSAVVLWQPRYIAPIYTVYIYHRDATVRLSRNLKIVASSSPRREVHELQAASCFVTLILIGVLVALQVLCLYC